MISKNITGIVQEEENMYSTLDQRISKTQKTAAIAAGILGITLIAQQCTSPNNQQPTTPGYNIILSEPCIKAHEQHIDVTPCYQINNEDS